MVAKAPPEWLISQALFPALSDFAFPDSCNSFSDLAGMESWVADNNNNRHIIVIYISYQRRRWIGGPCGPDAAALIRYGTWIHANPASFTGEWGVATWPHPVLGLDPGPTSSSCPLSWPLPSTGAPFWTQLSSLTTSIWYPDANSPWRRLCYVSFLFAYFSIVFHLTDCLIIFLSSTTQIYCSSGHLVKTAFLTRTVKPVFLSSLYFATLATSRK